MIKYCPICRTQLTTSRYCKQCKQVKTEWLYEADLKSSIEGVLLTLNMNMERDVDNRGEF